MKALVIALYTYKELNKDKLNLSLLFIGFFMIFSSILMADLSFVQRNRIVMDVGLASITIIGAMLAILNSFNIINKEVEHKRIYALISRPIKKHQIIIGKYLGILLVLFFYLSVLMIFFFLFYYYEFRVIKIELYKAWLLTLIELMVITAMGMLFASFTTPTLSIFYNMIFFIIGHMTRDLKVYWKAGSAITRYVTKVAYYSIPNLHLFNVKSELTNDIYIKPTYLINSFLYGAIYIFIIILILIYIFQNKNFE